MDNSTSNGPIFHDTTARAALAAAERRLQRQSDEIDRLRLALDASTAECARLYLSEPAVLVALLRGVMEDDPGSISAAAGWLDEYDTDAPDLAANDAHVAATVAMERGREIDRLLRVIATMRQDRRELDEALSDAEHRLTMVADARGHGLGC